MKLDRLLAIVILLLNRRMVQAKELAERFEVSVRTIYRDIEAINQAGIPIVTHQGTGGGIGLIDGFRLDRNVLTGDELASILTALHSISTSYPEPKNRELVEKLNSIVPPGREEELKHKSSQVLFDFSHWGENSLLEDQLSLLKDAIGQTQLVMFHYRNSRGDFTNRCVEPHTLVWKGRDWYLQAFCRTRNEFRLFKLLRIKDLEPLPELFARRELPRQERGIGRDWVNDNNRVNLVLRLGGSLEGQAQEWFHAEELEPHPDGGWIVRKCYPEDEWLYGFILSLGPQAELLEPERLRTLIGERARRIADLYGGRTP
ncbi:helix-turn-helix transcriptional regulator [Paenibacillus sp. CAU 1782]